MKFQLEIELGNDAMQTTEDVAEALEQVAKELSLIVSGWGSIRDRNGNKVGTWKLVGLA